MADRFAADTGAIAVGQAAVKLSQVVLAMALVRMLSPAQWNEAAFVLSIYLAATTIGTLGIHHALLYHLPRVAVHQQRGLVTRAMSLLLAIGGLTAAAMTAVGPQVAGHHLSGTSRWALLGVAVAVELPSSSLETVLVVSRRFVAAALWNVCGAAATVGAVVFSAGRGGVTSGLILAGCCRLIVGGRLVVGRMPGGDRGAVPVAHVLGLVRYGLPLGLLVSVTILNRIVDKWLIAALHPNDFGLYSVAAQEVPLLVVLPYAGGAALAASLVCAFRDHDIATARTHWLHLTSRMSRVVVPLGVGVALVGGPLIEILFGAGFQRATPPFQIFTLIGIHRVAEYGLLLRAAGRNRAVVEVAVTTLVANLMLAGAGAAIGGMTGAALGTAAATAIGWWRAMHHISRSLGVSMAEAFAWKTWCAAVAMTSLAAAAAVTMTAPFEFGPVTQIAARASLFTLVYVPLASRWFRSRRAADPIERWVPGAGRQDALEAVAG